MQRELYRVNKSPVFQKQGCLRENGLTIFLGIVFFFGAIKSLGGNIFIMNSNYSNEIRKQSNNWFNYIEVNRYEF
ncbi:MAG: hypothetical protein R8L53_08655 [Mariprofundales bacterium]